MGTTIYEIFLRSAKNAFRFDNLLLWAALDEYGWDALDIEKYHIGSAIIDDVLYLLDTDGEYVDLVGDGVPVDPESLLMEYDVDALYDAEYIEEASEQDIRELISGYDLNPDAIDATVLARRMLDEGANIYDVIQLLQDAQLLV